MSCNVGGVCLLAAGLEPQEGHRHRGIGCRSDGTPFPVEVTIAKSSYGTTFYVAVVRDLTEEVALRQRLEACTCNQGLNESRVASAQC